MGHQLVGRAATSGEVPETLASMNYDRLAHRTHHSKDNTDPEHQPEQGLEGKLMVAHGAISYRWRLIFPKAFCQATAPSQVVGRRVTSQKTLQSRA